LPTGTPHAATSGSTTSVTLSPTPPVECLSTARSTTSLRSSTVPELAIASVSAVVSSAVMPWKNTAISHAATW
jgi:hypothetical protein